MVSGVGERLAKPHLSAQVKVCGLKKKLRQTNLLHTWKENRDVSKHWKSIYRSLREECNALHYSAGCYGEPSYKGFMTERLVKEQRTGQSENVCVCCVCVCNCIRWWNVLTAPVCRPSSLSLNLTPYLAWCQKLLVCCFVRNKHANEIKVNMSALN